MIHPSTWHIQTFREVLDDNFLSGQLGGFDFSKARDALELLSLVTVNPDTNEISMNPLVHTWAKNRLEARAQEKAWVASLSILYLSIGNSNHRFQTFFHKIQVHITACIRAPPEEHWLKSSQRTQVLQMFLSFISPLIHAGSTDLAEKLATFILSSIDQYMGLQPEIWRETTFLLSICQCKLRKYVESLQSIDEVVGFDEANQKIEARDRESALEQRARVRRKLPRKLHHGSGRELTRRNIYIPRFDEVEMP